MKSLIIGFGSIGMRHSEVLRDLGSKVSVLSKRKLDSMKSFRTLESALSGENYNLIIIANNTNEHIPTLLDIRNNGFKGPVLIEKPLSDDISNVPSGLFENTFVAYNMRFNPLINKLKDAIKKDSDVVSVHSYVGQYLPHWNEERDYRKTYSAKKNLGGGVIRDLSHELDFLCWLFGDWKAITAIGGKFSNLEIDTDDIFSLMFTTNICPSIFVQMNYLDRVPKRNLILKTNRHVYEIDFLEKTFTKDSMQESMQFDRNHTYIKQNRALLSDDLKNICTFESGRKILSLISAAEKSAYSEERRWITNEENM